MPNRSLLLVFALCTVPALVWAGESSAPTCASLRKLALPNVTINVAERVAAGAFVPPDLKPDEKVPPLYRKTPAFCRVSATLKPTADSDIKVEIWMPASGWNGRFRGLGNGGFAGYIAYRGLASAVTQGYAAASTDTGHSTEGAEWALGHAEKFVDYGYRAIHETAVDAKSVVKAFYGDAPKQSYFSSCSNGGRQALMEAQRYPEDYDGIIAGAPANNWAPMLTSGLKVVQTLDRNGYIPAAKIPAVSKAVLAACDAQDGLKDGLLNDPRQCHFDPSTMLCKGKDSNECLTKAQSESLKVIYAGLRDATGKQLFPGLLPGAEEGDGGWKLWITGSEKGKSLAGSFVIGYFADMVYGDKDWDFRKANTESSLKLAYEKTGDTMDATNPDLKAFLGHGGKLILYHGWNDPAISAENSVNYYNSVVAAVGGPAEPGVRLYMVAGMQHCGGGPGATSFGQSDTFERADAQHDIFAALVEWVEQGKAPAAIIATREGDPAKTAPMSRPICPYPQAPKYNGTGDPNQASSFVCSEGK